MWFSLLLEGSVWGIDWRYRWLDHTQQLPRAMPMTELNPFRSISTSGQWILDGYETGHTQDALWSDKGFQWPTEDQNPNRAFSLWLTTLKWQLSCSVMSDSFETPQTSLPGSMEFSMQEYWSGLPFPSLGDLPDPGMEPRSHALHADSVQSESPGKPNFSPGKNPK